MSAVSIGAAPWAMAATVLAFSSPVSAQTEVGAAWTYGAFVDVARLAAVNAPDTDVFRGRGTTFRLNEWDVNLGAVSVRKRASDRSRAGMELTVQGGRDTNLFGFSPSAPNVSAANWLLHFGPSNVSYLAPIGSGLTIQAGIVPSIIGYDSLYAKDNFNYTRPWGADYTPYLMLGVAVSHSLRPRLRGTFIVTNGYFHLAHANDAPNVGVQLSFIASDRVSVKQATLVGSHQPETAFEFWRVLSDTIVERRGDRLVAAAEYQLGTERVAAAGGASALWMSAQVPVHWVVRDPWSVTVRPELAWDRDGRWIAGAVGAGQSVIAITSTVEWRLARQPAGLLIRIEHRYDHSRGQGGGFFDGPDRLKPGQHLAVVAAIATVDGPIRGSPK